MELNQRVLDNVTNSLNFMDQKYSQAHGEIKLIRKSIGQVEQKLKGEKEGLTTEKKQELFKDIFTIRDRMKDVKEDSKREDEFKIRFDKEEIFRAVMSMIKI